MAEIAERTVIIDPRAGNTTEELWQRSAQTPHFIETNDVDAWLDAIAAGRGVGTTAAATADYHLRPGVVYRSIADGPRIPVRLVWWRDDPPAGLADLIDMVADLYASEPRALRRASAPRH